MKQLIFLLTIITATALLKADESGEILWEVDVESGLGELILSPLGDTFFNTKDSIVQIRNVKNGALIDEIDVNNFNEDIKNLSISDNGRYLALSGDTPYVIIFDLLEKKEINRLTTVVYERQEGDRFVTYSTDKWVSSSISPDGTKFVGVAKNEDVYSKTNLVVIEIESGEILFEERRISYDTFSPSDNSPEWEFSKYTYDGSKIVVQLEYKTSNPSSPDSIYLIDSDTYKTDTILTNSYSESLFFDFVSNYSPLIHFKDEGVNKIYNVLEKNIINMDVEGNLWNIQFLRNNDLLIYGSGFESKIYDIYNKNILYDYNLVTEVKCQIDDGNRLFSLLYNKLYSLELKSNLTKVDISEETFELSPNPTTGEFRIKLNSQIPSEFYFELISLSGQVAKSNSLGFIGINSDEITINISEVSNGQYTLRVYSNQEEFVFNLIKEG